MAIILRLSIWWFPKARILKRFGIWASITNCVGCGGHGCASEVTWEGAKDRRATLWRCTVGLALLLRTLEAFRSCTTSQFFSTLFTFFFGFSRTQPFFHDVLQSSWRFGGHLWDGRKLRRSSNGEKIRTAHPPSKNLTDRNREKTNRKHKEKNKTKLSKTRNSTLHIPSIQRSSTMTIISHSFDNFVYSGRGRQRNDGDNFRDASLNFSKYRRRCLIVFSWCFFLFSLGDAFLCALRRAEEDLG